MKLNENSQVPIKWILLPLVFSIGALGSVLVGSLAVGAWTAKVVLGQDSLKKEIDDSSARIASVEASRDQVTEYSRQLNTKIEVINAKVDFLVSREKSRGGGK